MRLVDDGKAILSAQSSKLSKIASIYTAIVRRKEKFTDMMQCSLSYARAFKENYSVQFFYMGILNTVECTMCFDFF